MKSYKTLTLGAVISSVLLAASFQANAATSIAASSYLITDTTGATATEFKNTNGASWVSESMGFQGWTHFSKWGFVKLTKGKTVTIVADATAIPATTAAAAVPASCSNSAHTTQATCVSPEIWTPAVAASVDATAGGYHPGITVWQRKTSLSALPSAVSSPATGAAPTASQQLFYMVDHSYGQASDINVANTSDETTAVKTGNINMTYIASGYDIDGLGDKFTLDTTSGMLRPYVAATDAAATVYGPYLPMGFAAAGLADSQKLSDSANATATPPVVAKTPGRVELKFTVPATGIYQFVVGGLKPDAGSAAATKAGSMMGNVNTVKVTVKQQ